MQRATGSANNRSFRNRRVDYAFFAKLIDQAISDFERAAIKTNVFTDDEHSRVAFHLFPDTLSYCFNERGKAAARGAIRFMLFFESR